MLSYYVVKQMVGCILHRKPLFSSDIMQGLRMYRNGKGGGDFKSPIQVFFDLRRLSSYWHAFPDSYFRFGMFVKDFGDMERMKSFVPQGAYARFCGDGANSKYNILIDDKILFHDIMSHYGLPVPTRFFVFRNGEFREGQRQLTDDAVDSILQSINDEQIFVKRFTGGAASGVSIFSKKSNGGYVNMYGEDVSAKMIRLRYAGQDFIFEKLIRQEQDLSQFNPDTVNTIRVLTYNNQIISASVRFGGKNNYVDNTAKGGIAVDLDLETGILGAYGQREYDLTKYFEHPDTHVRFADVKVHQWLEVRAIVEKTIHFLPYYKSVGFDVATTDNGPVIIEINTGSGVYLSQMGKEYGLRDYFVNK